ncbi:hypothetical protein GLGCALEP_05385 [Pseudomonas sp. MM221]|nr:hypothetical protein DBADOPDK_05264 [Pseudomonas sp. MM223]CAI3809205.1 hypothetical protein GLGCALEP_05385 [Pseudomonas sp. MM221]
MENPSANSLIDPDYKAAIPESIGTIETSLHTVNGRICVGSAYVNDATHYALLRLKDNGELDTTFGKQGLTTGSFGRTQSLIYSVTELDDGALLVIGLTSEGSYFFDGVPVLARFTKDGTLDENFQGKGYVIIERPEGLKQEPRVLPLKKEQLKQEQSESKQNPSLSNNYPIRCVGDKILVLGNYFGLNCVLMTFDLNGNRDGFTELKRSDDTWLHGLNLHASEEAILICARIYNDLGLPNGGCVVSLTPEGEYSPGFGTDGVANFPTALKTVENFLVLPAAKRIIGCGMGESREGVLVAMTTKGGEDDFRFSQLRDYSLGWNQLVAFSPQRADSRLLAAGVWNNRINAPMLLGRFCADGKLDDSFGDGGTKDILLDDMISTAARRCEIDSNGKTLVHCMSTKSTAIAYGTLIRCLTAISD